MTNNRAKGDELQEYVAKKIRETGLDLKAKSNPDSGSGTGEKSDIVTDLQICGLNAGIECKNHAKANVKIWWDQTIKLESLGYEPVLAYKLDNEPMEDTKVVLRLDTLLELLQEAQGVTTEKVITIGESREIQYKGDNVIRSIKELVKALKREEEL